MDLLIKNGTVVNHDQSQSADVLVSNGSISKFGANLSQSYSSTKIIDANGKYIFPGGIDPHVHMHLPTPAGFSSDDFYSGSRAALLGGTTTIIDFVTPRRGQSLVEALEQRKAEAEQSMANTYFHVSPVEWRNSIADEIRECIHNYGIKSFKCYMAYKSNIGLDDDALFKVMQIVGIEGALLTLHCEDGDEIEKLRATYAGSDLPKPLAHVKSRPPELEAKAVKSAIALAKKANCPIYIVHVSSKLSLDLIKEAQACGQKVYAETCPHYLLLDKSRYDQSFEKAAAFVMSPPLRKIEDNNALWEGIVDGSISSIGTDHCPFTLAQKKKGIEDFRKIPNGAGGVEHRMALLFTYGVQQNKISLNRFVEITSTNPAKIFGLYPQKGIIREGADADLLIWNPESRQMISAKTHHSNCDLNVYEGFQTLGEAECVIRGGKLVVEAGRLI